MDINDFRTIATVLCFTAIIGVFIWVYLPTRKKVYDDAALAPFTQDDDLTDKPQSEKEQG